MLLLLLIILLLLPEEISHFHLERLAKLCRLCGNKVIIGTGYSGQFTVNFKENILVKYGVNVET